MARIYRGGFEISHCRQGLAEKIFGKETGFLLVLWKLLLYGVLCAVC
jgi:hypothetical protein